MLISLSHWGLYQWDWRKRAIPFEDVKHAEFIDGSWSWVLKDGRTIPGDIAVARVCVLAIQTAQLAPIRGQDVDRADCPMISMRGAPLVREF